LRGAPGADLEVLEMVGEAAQAGLPLPEVFEIEAKAGLTPKRLDRTGMKSSWLSRLDTGSRVVTPYRTL
jgi:hypothetical protein